jgi:hypothetical protein
MTLHTKISYIKSGFRIIGCIGAMAFGNFAVFVFGLAFLIGEVLGIAEEAWPGAYEGTKTDADAN